MHKHRIILKNFDLEDGKISISKLKELLEKITALAEGAVLNLIEGRSKPRQGQNPKWLRDILDFQLTGISSGSTILNLEAPEIAKIYKNRQHGIFDEPEFETLFTGSAFDLACFTYRKAVESSETSVFIDKYLLQKITAFNNVLDSEFSEIILASQQKGKISYVGIQRKELAEISIIEHNTLESVKTSITGLLDVLRHNKEQMEIVTDEDKRIRAFAGDNFNIRNLKNFFGEKVKVTGLAHFKTDSNLKYIEILDIQPAVNSEGTIEELTLPIFDDLNLKRLAKEQSWHGFDEKKFREMIQELAIEESPEDLLELLKS